MKDTIEITSLQRTLSKAPILSFPILLIIFTSVNNLSMVDKLPGPNLSFIERFHCIIGKKVENLTCYLKEIKIDSNYTVVDCLQLYRNTDSSNTPKRTCYKITTLLLRLHT